MARLSGAGRVRVQQPTEVPAIRSIMVPSPDPTVATTESLLREIAHTKDFGDALVKFVRELVEQKIIGAREALEARLNGNDQAVTLLRSTTDKIPVLVDGAVRQLREVIEQKLLTQDEKFRSVDTQFVERDTRTDQRAGDTKLAVDAAFAAAKESTAKIETGFTKQIDGLIALVESKTQNLMSALNDLKERQTLTEARTQGITANALENRQSARDTHQVSRDNTATYLGIIAVVIAIVVPVAIRLIR